MIWITIPLPSVQEQTQILYEIESRLSVVKIVEQAIEENLLRAERLRRDLLGTAFSGGLVKNSRLDARKSGEAEKIVSTLTIADL